MRHDEGTLATGDGLTLYQQWWLPDDDPKAIVLLWHGLGEHSGRYQHVAEALTDAGYGVYAVDHRGHGRSDGKRTFVRSYNEFMDDLVLARNFAQEQHPRLPLFVLGHSMGGNLALSHVLDHQEGLAGVVLSGALVKPGDDVTPTELKLLELVAKVAPSVRPKALDATSISRDPAVVEDNVQDPLVYSGKISAGMAAALMQSTRRFPDRFVELRLPVLVLHGTEDRLVSIEGSRELEAGAVNADVTAHYYDGLYHEVFNEPEQATVLADLVTWLDKTTSN